MVDYSASSGGIIRIFFSIYFNMKGCCVFSLESLHRGDSNEYTKHAIMKISSRLGLFEPMRVDYSASSGGIIGILFPFTLT